MNPYPVVDDFLRAVEGKAANKASGTPAVAGTLDNLIPALRQLQGQFGVDVQPRVARLRAVFKKMLAELDAAYPPPNEERNQ
ncbi:MAG TPA: hypothetical protein VEG64_16920 [Candidatus Sulfotelmatobacter sp.]|nr:hypothetical protein [Candidatus Sulfotelmatobacter sp.]